MRKDRARMMMRTSAELKAIAKDSLRGNYGKAIGAMILYTLVSSVVFCAPPMMVGYCKFNNRLIRRQEVGVDAVFDGFDLFGKAWWLSIITAVFVWLWTLLFVIPGIIKSLAYSLAPYVLSDNPKMTAREALRASIDLTNGNKGKLFYLFLSFIGWIILGSLTLGIAYLWIIPYMNATFAAFYNETLLEQNNRMQ